MSGTLHRKVSTHSSVHLHYSSVAQKAEHEKSRALPNRTNMGRHQRFQNQNLPLILLDFASTFIYHSLGNCINSQQTLSKAGLSNSWQWCCFHTIELSVHGHRDLSQARSKIMVRI